MAINRPVVKEYFDNQQAAGMKPRSRINVRANMTAFFNHCLERGWIDHSPCVRIKIKVPDNEVSILTIEQTVALMTAAAKSRHAAQMVPYFAVCLFAGLRPTETMRLDWSRIRFEDGGIEIMKETTKTRRRRWAKIEPNGLEWLKPYARKSGCLVGGISEMTWKRQFIAIRKAAALLPEKEGALESENPGTQGAWDQDHAPFLRVLLARSEQGRCEARGDHGKHRLDHQATY